MTTKRILVADAQSGAIAQFSQALGSEWEIIPAFNGADALTLLNEQPCQVVVANLDLPELDGAELLNRVRRKFPRTVRFLAARDDDKQRVVKTARGAHQFLSTPYDSGAIKDAIERALALDVWVSSDRVREAIARIRSLPTIPTLYLEVVAALRSEDTTTEQIGAIIAKDMAMMTKILQLLNSACFGLTREITDPAEAVGILGFETVKTMVMTIKLLNQYDKLKASDFSIDRLWSHSTAVARTARQVALLETGDRALGDAAFTAGLLHDLGKVVMVANFEDSYSGALLLGFKQKLTAWDVEKEIFGANHGEIGAYLLGLWGMPLNLLEATALHHEPSRSENKAFSPLTAVHVANVFERAISPDDLGMINPKLDEAYLDGLGLLNRVPVWRDAIFNRDGVKIEPKTNVTTVTEIAETAEVAHAVEDFVPAPVAETPATISASEETVHIPARKRALAAESTFSRNRWLFTGAGVGAVLLLAWCSIQLFSSDPDSAQFAPPVKSPVKLAAQPGKPAVVTAAAKPATASDVALSLLPATTVRARENTDTTTTTADSPKSILTADFKLQGIFYYDGDPSAIVNGKTVRLNDKVDGAQVVAITSSNLTLQIQNQRRLLAIK